MTHDFPCGRSLPTTLCLQYPASTIGYAALYIMAERCLFNFPLPEGVSSFFDMFAITPEVVEGEGALRCADSFAGGREGGFIPCPAPGLGPCDLSELRPQLMAPYTATIKPTPPPTATRPGSGSEATAPPPPAAATNPPPPLVRAGNQGPPKPSFRVVLSADTPPVEVEEGELPADVPTSDQGGLTAGGQDDVSPLLPPSNGSGDQNNNNESDDRVDRHKREASRKRTLEDDSQQFYESRKSPRRV